MHKVSFGFCSDIFRPDFGADECLGGSANEPQCSWNFTGNGITAPPGNNAVGECLKCSVLNQTYPASSYLSLIE